MNVPEDLRYSSDHEWARTTDGGIRVGITDYAQDALGDVVFVDLPTPGTTIEAGGLLGEVESTKSVSEIYAPVAGEVVAVNAGPHRRPRAAERRPVRRGLDLRDRPERSVRGGRAARRHRLPAADGRLSPATGALVGSGSLGATTLDHVFCHHCGHRNPEGVNFCSSCGASMVTSAPDTSVSVAPVDDAGRCR